jgi:hypothetical protein
VSTLDIEMKRQHGAVDTKLAIIRANLGKAGAGAGAGALRLRGSDWFAWATAGLQV